LLLLAFSAPAQSPQTTVPGRAELSRFIGLYRFGDGSFAEIGWLDDIQGLLLIDYPAGRIRALHPVSPNHFTTGQTVIAAEPVQARLTFDGPVLHWSEAGRDRAALRAAFREREVVIQSGNVRLAGTLTLPPGPGPFAAVVLLHGGGAQDRNFLWVAPFFADAGVAVLAYDKRGVGGSTGDWRSAVAADLASDAVAAVDFLRAQPEIDRGRIGLYGSSNGGWVAPIAATVAPERIAFVIARSASGLPERRNVIYETESDLRQAGYDDAVLARVRALHERAIHAFLTDGEGWNALRADIAAASSEPWFSLARLPTDLPELNDANRNAVNGAIAWNRRGWVDPAAMWERVGCPVLVQNGSSDIYVPGAPSVAIIRAALARAGNRTAEIHLYPNGDHGLFESPRGYRADIGSVTRFVPGYLTDLRTWIARYVTGPAAPRGRGCARR
jgi:hypothetical protein